MSITLANVSEVVETILSAEPCNVSEETVVFDCAVNYYIAEISLSMREIGPTSLDKETYQAVEIVICFLNDDESRMNIRMLTRPEVLDLCNCLQDDIPWGSLTPLFMSDDKIYMSLYRMVHITAHDLHLAVNADMNSELFRTLVRMLDEWEHLSPIFSGIETGQITSPRGVSLLLDDPVHHA